MSFEAVPCMFKSRQEDGNEAQLFGLLIRPSATTAQQQSALLPGAVPIAALSAGPSAIQIVPNPSSSSSSSSDIATKKVLPAKDGRAVSRCGSTLFSTNSATPNGIASAAALFAAGTSNGMPPILPRPKNGKTVARLSQQQQLMRSLVQLPTKTTATLAFEMAQSPQQILPQFCPATISLDSCDALTVSTASSSSSSGCSSSTTPSLLCSSVSSAFPSQTSPSAFSKNNSNGLLAIHSPPQKTQSQKGAGVKSSTTTSKTPRRRRSRQTLAPEETVGNGSSKNNGTETDSAGGGGSDLLGDLHSIEYSQLVNSSVITTEDYLTSQSDPIYTNMDMYSSSSLAAAHHQQQNGQLEANVNGKSEQKRQTVGAEKNVPSSSATVAPSLCPSAIFIHNQQQQNHFLNQQNHSSASVRFALSVGTPAAVVPPAPPPSQQQQQHPSHWHPYIGAHPGGPSHISSTPDSGIQSIDGSPPSVYTPPMVSPYASQVRSCESVNNGVHNGMPSSSSAVCAAGGVVTNPSSSSSNNGTLSFYGTSAYSSQTEESLTITAFAPSSSIFLSSSLNVPPSLIIEQLPEGENGGGETTNKQKKRQILEQQQQEEEEDFSDMPKLVPVTHMEHDDEVAEQDELVARPVPGTSAIEPPMAEEEGKRTTAPIFHQGMSLHELAECLSSNISREQLKQLTSLIQRKAEEQKNNLEGGGEQNERERREQRRKKHGGDEEEEGEEEENIGVEVGQKGGEQREEEGKREERRKRDREEEGSREERRKEERRKKDKEEERKKEERRKKDKEEERRKRDREEEGSREERRKEERRKKDKEEERRKRVMTNKEAEKEQKEAEEEGPPEKRILNVEETERKARDFEQLAIYRARVRQQLNRKLTALLERVIRRMDKCHLNISPAGGAELTHKEWPWKKINWEEIHRRAETRGEAWMMTTAETKKRRGIKRKSAQEEERLCVRKRAGEKQRVNGERGDREKRGKRERRGEEEAEDGQTKKRGGRKRKGREADEETEKQTKKVHEEGGERHEKSEETGEKEDKQNTPPIILRIRPLPPSLAAAKPPSALSTIKRMTAPRATIGRSSESVHSPATVAKRRKPSSSPRPCCFSSSSSSSAVVVADNFLRERCHSSAALSAVDGGKNNAIGGRRWTTTTGRRTKGGRKGTPTQEQRQLQHNNNNNNSTRRPRRTRRREMPNLADILSDGERAIVHSKRCFLIRNLSKRRQMDGGGTQSQQSAEASELTQILEHFLANFCAIFERCFVSDRKLDELIRTVKLIFSSVGDPYNLLVHFDSLLKQFIFSSVHHHDSIHAQYENLKQSVDFGKMKHSLPNDALSAFLDESRIRSPSASHRRDAFHRPLTVNTAIDLSYLDSPHPVGQWDPDKAAKLSPTSDNRDHDCVRCICGIAEDDGVMSQCDRCHFWLHADCLDCPILDDQKEFVCDFCIRRIETTPRVDIVLKPQPNIKLSGCTYYRTLVNSRGLQVRLNESVYVERLINDKHKGILRELHEECVRKQQLAHNAQQNAQKRGRGSIGKRKSGGKMVGKTEQQQQQQNEESTSKSEANRWWPEQTEDDGCDETENGGEQMPTTSDGKMRSDVNDGTATGDNGGKQFFQFHRRDLRVFRIERLFCSPNGQRFIFGCYYARPHETFCDSSRTFFRNELFWTPLFDTLPLDSVVGRCLVLEPQIWAMGRPKSPRYLEDDVFVCEYQIDRNQRSFEKIPPKNRYYINTEPYVFNVFENKLTMKRDFTPFKITNSIPSDNKPSSSTASRTDCSCTTSPPLFNNSLIRQQLLQMHLESVCSKINGRKRLLAEEASVDQPTQFGQMSDH